MKESVVTGVYLKFIIFATVMQKENGISRDFFSFPVQILHFAGIPLFFLLFIEVYRPEAIVEFLSVGVVSPEFNVCILASILLVVLVGFRLAFYFLRNRLNPGGGIYALWCAGEIAVFAAFGALYMTLISSGAYGFFPCLAKSLLYFFGTLLWPYVIFALWIGCRSKSGKPAPETDIADGMIRFSDDSQRLKLTVATSSLLFVQANENYVNIAYMDSGKVRHYQLRSSMKRLEDMLQAHGLQRCHRAWFVNPAHIKILRKTHDGAVLADLDIEGCQSIPVSRAKYDDLSALL